MQKSHVRTNVCSVYSLKCVVHMPPPYVHIPWTWFIFCRGALPARFEPLYIYIYICIHTYILICMHTYTHTYICTYQDYSSRLSRAHTLSDSRIAASSGANGFGCAAGPEGQVSAYASGSLSMPAYLAHTASTYVYMYIYKYTRMYTWQVP